MRSRVYQINIHSQSRLLVALIGTFSLCVFFIKMIMSKFFPYTTLFRSNVGNGAPHRTAKAELVAHQPHSGAEAAGMGLMRYKLDRKSTRLNSSHPSSSYAVFC